MKNQDNPILVLHKTQGAHAVDEHIRAARLGKTQPFSQQHLDHAVRFAAERGKLDLFDVVFPLSDQQSDPIRAFVLACENNHPQITHRLCHSVDNTNLSRNDWHPLRAACQANALEVLETFAHIHARCPIPAGAVHKALLSAARQGKTSLIDALVPLHTPSHVIHSQQLISAACASNDVAVFRHCVEVFGPHAFSLKSEAKRFTEQLGMIAARENSVEINAAVMKMMEVTPQTKAVDYAIEAIRKNKDGTQVALLWLRPHYPLDSLDRMRTHMLQGVLDILQNEALNAQLTHELSTHGAFTAKRKM